MISHFVKPGVDNAVCRHNRSTLIIADNLLANWEGVSFSHNCNFCWWIRACSTTGCSGLLVDGVLLGIQGKQQQLPVKRLPQAGFSVRGSLLEGMKQLRLKLGAFLFFSSGKLGFIFWLHWLSGGNSSLKVTKSSVCSMRMTRRWRKELRLELCIFCLSDCSEFICWLYLLFTK